MDERTIRNSLEFLTTDFKDHEALLIRQCMNMNSKGEVSIGFSRRKGRVPNIYVLNEEGFGKEGVLAVNYVAEHYSKCKGKNPNPVPRIGDDDEW